MKQISIILISFTAMLYSEGISGVTYFKYSDDAFSINRTYFTYKKNVSDQLSFMFQTDVGQLADSESDPAEDHSWTIYLKKAQLNWKINDSMKIFMGMIGMNMFNIKEKTWGNRFVAKSAMDINGYSSSADLGFGISRDFGPVVVSALMTNGEGYKDSSTDENSKKSIQLLYGESRLDENDGYNVGTVYSNLCKNSHNCTTVTGFFGGWSGSNITVGAESNIKEVDSISASLASIYANYSLNDNSSMFVRIDSNDPNSDVDDDESDTKWIGFKWTPTKGLDICPTLVQTDEDDTFAVNFQFQF